MPQENPPAAHDQPSADVVHNYSISGDTAHPLAMNITNNTATAGGIPQNV